MFSLLFSLILFSISYVMSDQIIGQQVEYLKIRSTIQSRFAVTTFSSKIRNLENKAREIFFHTVIPEEAFITNFSMLIKDDIIYGNVQEKEKAKETYSKAVKRGQSAGLVAEKPRETNSFQISVNVGANESVIFDLTYQEVLKRVHGFYKHVINVETEEQVQDMNIEVKISEMGKIKSVKVPKFEPKIGEKTNLELLSSPGETKANIDIIDLGGISEATVKFSGDDNLANKTVGQLAVLYDVQRDETAGSVQVLDGHFVHFFAPSGLTKGKKHIFFVLDRSGSMSGKKFAQLKDAMKRIIGELDEQDKFNILFFDHKLYPWKLESVMATKERKQEAIQHVINTETAGATDIFLALKTAIERIQIEYTDNFSPMILFLTDGEATSGIQDNNLIVQKVTELNKNSTVSGATCSIHGLAFGRGADYKLVQRLSANNRGLAKKIFEDADADLQLTGFYAEIASPLLSDVKFHYLNGTVDVNSLVQLGEYNYYDGGELVVIGKLVNDSTEPQVSATSTTTTEGPQIFNPLFDVQVTARAVSGAPSRARRTFNTRAVTCCFRPWCPYPRPPRPLVREQAPEKLEPSTSLQGFVERMWAYLTVKKLLKQYELEPKDNEAKKAEALRLSLKYKFVTSLTSMVVVQPDGNKTSDLEQNKSPSSSPTSFNYHKSMRRAPGMSMLRSGGFGRGGGSRGSVGQRSRSGMYVYPTTDDPVRRLITQTSTLKSSPALREKPLVVYFEASDDVPSTVVSQNVQFLKNIEKGASAKSSSIFMQIFYLKVSQNQTNFQTFDVLPPTRMETSEISALQQRHGAMLDNSPGKQTILDNSKKDGGHVTLLLLKGRLGVPSLNAALQRFLIGEMKTATWVFMGCFDACQFDLTDMPPEWTRFKILTDVNAYDQVREKLFE